MKLLKSIIPWAATQAILALICMLVYNYILGDLFSQDVSYIQWLGIIIIVACVMPTGKKGKDGKEEPAPSMENMINQFMKKK